MLRQLINTDYYRFQKIEPIYNARNNGGTYGISIQMRPLHDVEVAFALSAEETIDFATKLMKAAGEVIRLQEEKEDKERSIRGT